MSSSQDNSDNEALAGARERIDALDAQIQALIAERAGVADRMSRPEATTRPAPAGIPPKSL